MADNQRSLTVNLALKSQSFEKQLKTNMNNIKSLKKETELLEQEVDDFGDSLEGLGTKYKQQNKIMSEYNKRLDLQKSQLKATQTTLEKLTDKYQDQARKIDDLKDRLAQAEQEYGRNSQQAKELREEQTKLEKSFERTGKSITNCADRITRFETEIKSTKIEINKLSKEMQETQNEIEKFGKNSGLKNFIYDLKDTYKESVKVAENISDLGLNIQDFGSQISDMGDSILDSLSGVVDEIREIDRTINNLQVTTGATVEELKEFEEIAGNIASRGMAESFENAAESVSLVHRGLQLTGEELERASEDALFLSKNFGYDISESVRAVDNLMINMGLSADEAFGLVLKGAQDGADQSGELLDTITEYSVKFAEAGYSAEEMMSVFISGADAGIINLDKLADAQKEATIRLTDDTKDAIEAVESLGLSYDDIKKKLLQGGEVGKDAFLSVVNAIEETDNEAKRHQAALGIFSTMYEDMGIQGVLALNDIDTSFGDLSKVMAQTKEDSRGLDEALLGLNNSVTNNLFKPLKDVLEPVLVPVIDKISEFTENIKTFIENNPKVAAAIGILAGAFAIVLTVVGTLVQTIGGVVIAIGLLAPVFGTTAAAIGGAFLGILPIIGIVAGVIALVTAGIIANWDGIKSAVQQLVEKCQPAFEQIGQGFSDLWSVCQSIYDTIIAPLFKIIGEIIEEVILFCIPLFQAFSTAFSVVCTVIKVVWDSILKPVFEALMQVVQWVWEQIQPVIQRMREEFTDAFKTIQSVWENVLKPTLEILGEVVKTVIESALKFIKRLGDEAWPYIQPVVKAFESVIDVVSNLIGWFNDLIRLISGGLGSALSTVKGWFGIGRSIDVGVNVDDSQLRSFSLDNVDLTGQYYNPNTRQSQTLFSAFNEIQTPRVTVNQSDSDLYSMVKSNQQMISTLIQLIGNNSQSITELAKSFGDFNMQDKFVVEGNVTVGIEADGRSLAKVVAPYQAQANSRYEKLRGK